MLSAGPTSGTPRGQVTPAGPAEPSHPGSGGGEGDGNGDGSGDGEGDGTGEELGEGDVKGLGPGRGLGDGRAFDESASQFLLFPFSLHSSCDRSFGDLATLDDASRDALRVDEMKSSGEAAIKPTNREMRMIAAQTGREGAWAKWLTIDRRSPVEEMAKVVALTAC